MPSTLAPALIEQFLRYTAIESQSNASQSALPSSVGQMNLARLLKSELEHLGLVEIVLDEQSILTARLPATKGYEHAPKIGFVAHLDTVDVNLKPEIKAWVLKDYSGGDICLNQAEDIWLRVADYPEIERYKGDDILLSDGTSVLGADNKAAVTSIMVGLEAMIRQNLPHPEIHVAFVPDEEIGLRGAKAMDLSRLPVDFAYTIDCCELGQYNIDTFNAAHARLRIDGVSAHPMSAKGVMVNPALVAVDFINQLDRLQTPENTEGTEGYWWVNGIESNQSFAILDISIRDHDKKRFESRKAYVEQLVAFLRLRYPRAQFNLTISDTYANIADAMTPENACAVDYLLQAMQALEIEPKRFDMRGGTDGSSLSARGLFTPNFFTGAHNFHSNCEFLPVRSFVLSCQTFITLCRLVAQSGKAL
ncbi:MAG: peptidase T [Cardiobacteriaceae bacterium]|nr:peptidase T [Cardiobacteriaceae bacterium]